MHSKVKSWGNSLAVRIPKPIADKMGLSDGTEITISSEDGKLIIQRSQALPQYDLDNLLDQITPENRHDETDTGSPVGNETW